ncbi:MAG: alpha/beta fold hydrolase [Chloroflexi bacterium]|nr:alpha/beta fold hydrolase [Chloroflexota bacterium]
MVPAAFLFLDRWPLTPSDKIDYRALPAPAEAQTVSSAAAVVPRDRWELWLAQQWSDLLGRPGVDLDDNFFALGGHSLLAMRLMAAIQQQLGRSLPIAALLQAPTIRQLAAVLRQESGPEPWSPLVPLQPHGDRPPLFLIHPIGGTVFCYSDLVRQLDAEQPVYGLQARGVDGDDRPHNSIAAMAAEYVSAIRAQQARGPYLLGGWSLGGVVAFEIAQQLRRQGDQVPLLALIDSSPPINEDRQPEPARLVAAFVQDLAGLQGRRWMIEPGELDAVPADERPSYILSRARQQQLLPADISPAQIDRLIEVFRAHLVALHAYVPATWEERAAVLEARPDPDIQPRHTDAWRSWIDQLEVSQVAGDHYSLLRAPQVAAVAAWLQQQLALAQERSADVDEAASAAQHS